MSPELARCCPRNDNRIDYSGSAQRVQRARKALGWTQRQLASRARVSAYQVRKAERIGAVTLKCRILYALVAALDCDIVWVVEGREG